MLWVHLSCSGAVGWGTLAAKHECWDEWNHLLTDSDDVVWVLLSIMQSTVQFPSVFPSFILLTSFTIIYYRVHKYWIYMHVANSWFEKDHYLVRHSCILYIVSRPGERERERESNCCQGAVSDCPSQPRRGQNTDPWTKNHSFIHFLGLSNKMRANNQSIQLHKTRFITTLSLNVVWISFIQWLTTSTAKFLWAAQTKKGLHANSKNCMLAFVTACRLM